MKEYQKLKYCSGCEDDFYNGHNSYGVKECWNLKTAKIVWKKAIPIWLVPPYNHIHKQRVFNCFHKKGFVYMEDK